MKVLKKRSLAIILTLVMAVSLLPVAALAANADDYLEASFIRGEDENCLIGFALIFKGAQEDLLLSDITEFMVMFMNAAELDVGMEAEVEKDAAPKGEDGVALEQTHFFVYFSEPLSEEGTYDLTGKYKGKEIKASAEIGEAADPGPVEEPTEWAKDGIANLKTKGVIPAELLSAYTSNIRRDEFAALLWNVYVYAKGDIEVPAENKFNDIEGNGYKNQILKANSVGIISGRGDYFDAAGILNRQEMASMLNNLVAAIDGIVIPDADKTDFADNAAITPWAIKHVAFCHSQGLLAGKSNNMFDPQGTLTRQEALVAADNVMKNFTWGAPKEKSQLPKVPDEYEVLFWVKPTGGHGVELFDAKDMSSVTTVRPGEVLPVLEELENGNFYLFVVKINGKWVEVTAESRYFEKVFE